MEFQYFLVFFLAAVPWIELLLVIPGGIAMGLSPFWVALLAYSGNAIPVFLIVYGYRHWNNWRKNTMNTGAANISRRKQRAISIWNRYGLPGLALSGPIVTGIHLATLIALPFKPAGKTLLIWMNLSLLIWTVGVTVASFYGLEGIRSAVGYFSHLQGH